MDLKPPNVLLQDKNYLVAKIADLGLSRHITEGSLMTNPGHGEHSLRCGLSLLPAACCTLLCGTETGNMWQICRQQCGCAQKRFRECTCWTPQKHVTKCDLCAGTRAYMAPELVHMREDRLAHPWALDVYRCQASTASSWFIGMRGYLQPQQSSPPAAVSCTLCAAWQTSC